MDSITSLSLVRCFLILHRSWTEEDFQGRRFYNTVNRVFLNLLKEKRLEEAIKLLDKVVIIDEIIIFQNITVILLLVIKTKLFVINDKTFVFELLKSYNIVKANGMYHLKLLFSVTFIF